MTFIKAGGQLIHPSSIRSVDVESIEQGYVTISYDGGCVQARGFDAIEAVMILKPSALEGRRLKWKKGAWAFHNIVAHPVMQILAWMKFYKEAIWLHDVTTPHPRGFK